MKLDAWLHDRMDAMELIILDIVICNFKIIGPPCHGVGIIFAYLNV